MQATFCEWLKWLYSLFCIAFRNVTFPNFFGNVNVSMLLLLPCMLRKLSWLLFKNCDVMAVHAGFFKLQITHDYKLINDHDCGKSVRFGYRVWHMSRDLPQFKQNANLTL